MGKRLSKLDREALAAALEAMRQDSEVHRNQIDGMLKAGQPWVEVAMFAAGCMQNRVLSLKPWQVSPADARFFDRDDPQAHRGTRTAYELLARMKKAGLSQWHPNPTQALQQAADNAATKRR